MLVDHLLGLTITLFALAIHAVALIGVVRVIDRSIDRGVLHGHVARVVLFLLVASAICCCPIFCR